MENKKLVGKYLVTKWVHNSGFVMKELRRITRITKKEKYLVSDVQRTCRNYKDGNDEMIFIADWASKFRVVDGEIKRSVYNLTNTDGVFTVNILEELNQLLCKYSYEELFMTDIRKIQTKNSQPYSWISNISDLLESNSKIVKEDVWFINPQESDFYKEVSEFLKVFFNVEEVLYFSEYYEKDKPQSILSESATFFQITHFGGDKKVITRDENSYNIPIQFWYFGDKVVFTEDTGKSTW
jgi:hypothetical protein